jgi:hypothetical protein
MDPRRHTRLVGDFEIHRTCSDDDYNIVKRAE